MESIAAIVACLLISTQAQERVDPSSQEAFITGSVIDAQTGKALKGATVRLSKRGSRSPIAIKISDSNGRFEIRPVATGQYDLWAALVGYSEGGYQQLSAMGSWAPIEVPERGHLQTSLRLWKLGVIAGTVIDEAGEPAVNVKVIALEDDWSYETPRLIQSKASTAVSDDQGQYRINDLTSGTYVIGIAGAGTFHESGGLTGVDVDYPSAYSPGVTAADLAERIRIVPGDVRIGVNIRMPRPSPQTITITGRIVDGPDGLKWTVEMLPSFSPSVVLSDLDVRRYSSTDGRFAFPTVAPGTYTIRATAFTDFTNIRMLGRIGIDIPMPPDPNRPIDPKPAYWAETNITVTPEQQEDFVVRAMSGRQIRGKLNFEGSGGFPPDLTLLTASILIRPLSGRLFVELATGRVDLQGHFATVGLPPGRYGLQVGIRDGWTFQSLSIGNRTIPDAAIDIDRDNVTDVVITLTNKPSSLSGVVRSNDGKPAPGAAVFVFPVDQTLWREFNAIPPRVIQVRPNGDGQYSIKGLPPGDYLLTAVAAGIPDRWQNPSFLRTLQPAAMKIQIDRSGQVVQDLKLISAR